jgi:3-hydroxybutyryl-CoA dehydrogenase
MTEQIEHIAVVGAGYMSGGIAQVFAIAGLDVVICDADPDLARRPLIVYAVRPRTSRDKVSLSR